jgi:hypothetical protein
VLVAAQACSTWYVTPGFWDTPRELFGEEWVLGSFYKWSILAAVGWTAGAGSQGCSQQRRPAAVLAVPPGSWECMHSID